MAVKTNTKINGKDYFRVTASFGRDSEGKLIRKQFYGRTKKEAEAKKDEYAESIKNGMSLDFDKATLSSTMKSWLCDVLKSTVKPSTFERYDVTYRNYISVSDIANVKCSELSSLHVQQYLNKLKAEGKTKSQVSYVFRLLRQFLFYCEREGYVIRNVCKSVNIPKYEYSIEDEDTEVETFTNEEINKMINAKDKTIKLIALVSVSTGMRKGEILGLMWKDIDKENGVIHIRRSVKSVTMIDGDKRKYETVVQSTKNKSSVRDIPLTDSLIKLFSKASVMQKENMLKICGYNRENKDFVFLSNTGELIDSSNFTRSWTRFLKRLEIEHKKFHSLRHTYATKQFEAGTKLLTVSRLLGHSTTLMTEKTYTHVLKKEKEKALDILQDIL